jgi:hypothetical protein
MDGPALSLGLRPQGVTRRALVMYMIESGDKANFISAAGKGDSM